MSLTRWHHGQRQLENSSAPDSKDSYLTRHKDASRRRVVEDNGRRHILAHALWRQPQAHGMRPCAPFNSLLASTPPPLRACFGRGRLGAGLHELRLGHVVDRHGRLHDNLVQGLLAGGDPGELEDGAEMVAGLLPRVVDRLLPVHNASDVLPVDGDGGGGLDRPQGALVCARRRVGRGDHGLHSVVMVRAPNAPVEGREPDAVPDQNDDDELDGDEDLLVEDPPVARGGDVGRDEGDDTLDPAHHGEDQEALQLAQLHGGNRVPEDEGREEPLERELGAVPNADGHESEEDEVDVARVPHAEHRRRARDAVVPHDWPDDEHQDVEDDGNVHAQHARAQELAAGLHPARAPAQEERRGNGLLEGEVHLLQHPAHTLHRFVRGADAALVEAEVAEVDGDGLIQVPRPQHPLDVRHDKLGVRRPHEHREHVQHGVQAGHDEERRPP
mmetsp:Transcript_46819/g.114058  ORF Transcript_46819/g.114058 Transcript_46819/m.114058 type:complete len:443 (+) Transcript_46819:52-1380(+)